ncbi:uncharacterized protein LOC117120385 [Anneissia japonica]|uniref:uncharacterized protein LOC117120385 n=1 Tax=Anneissia japonica TaxID=1529436 RepID=UPI001425B960|nr:uncharacterized protein LOC117120385 [Anneissia japonica]
MPCGDHKCGDCCHPCHQIPPCSVPRDSQEEGYGCLVTCKSCSKGDDKSDLPPKKRRVLGFEGWYEEDHNELPAEFVMDSDSKLPDVSFETPVRRASSNPVRRATLIPTQKVTSTPVRQTPPSPAHTSGVQENENVFHPGPACRNETATKKSEQSVRSLAKHLQDQMRETNRCLRSMHDENARELREARKDEMEVLGKIQKAIDNQLEQQTQMMGRTAANQERLIGVLEALAAAAMRPQQYQHQYQPNSFLGQLNSGL